MDLVKDTIEAYRASAEDYISKHMDINVIKDEADLFLSKLEFPSKILDVGCGPGRDAKYFSENGFYVEGIDLVSEFIDQAKKNCPLGKFYLMDMRKMDFENGCFDGIWSMTSLLHIPRDQAEETLKEHARVLVDKGVMFLSTLEGNGNDPLPASPKYGGHSKFFYRYQESELKELLASSGFRIDSFVPDTIGKLTFFNVLATKK